MLLPQQRFFDDRLPAMMFQKSLCVAILIAAGTSVASAQPVPPSEDPAPPCKPTRANQKVTMSFANPSRVQDIAVAMHGMSCKAVVFSEDARRLGSRVTILGSEKLLPAQAMKLMVDAIEATGLVVVQQPKAIIIKLPPGVAPTCSDAPAVTTDAPTNSGSGSKDADADADATAALIAAGIKTIDDTHREIKRSLIDSILANPMSIAKGARVVPSMLDGKTNGFKLYAIRPSSVYAALGLLNGDTVTSINKMELTSADKALEAYSKLRDATAVEIQLLRRGKPLTLTITVVK
jgi:hypothetical protein